MQARTLAVAAAVLLTLVVGAQLAYTPVGQPVGERWTNPVTATALSATEDQGVLEVAAAGDGERGAVAWLVRADDRYRVEVASVTVERGRVELGPSRTVASSTRGLEGLDVAVAGDDVALVWERSLANDIVLHRDGETHVVSADPLRVAEPSVALVDGGAVVAWQEWNASVVGMQVAVVASGSVTYRFVPIGTGGTGSPAVDTTDDGIALTWFDASSRTTRTAFGRPGPDGPTFHANWTLGRARPSGGFGGGSGSVAVDASADGDVVRAVWFDLATLMTGQARLDGTVSEPVALGRGDRPAVAADGGRWLATWVVTGRAADTDLAFASGEAAGTLSRFPSSANHPSPFFAPDGGVAWSEQGAQSRVLVSGFRAAGGPKVLARLQAEPGRLAFVALAAAVVGLVTLPIMPWVFGSMLVAFYLTNRFFRERLVGALAWLAGLVVRTGGRPAVRARLDAVPPTVWAGVFAVGETAVLVALLPTVGGTVPLSFAGPVTLSVGAGLGTALLELVVPRRSPWAIAATFAYLQTAALWATALPDVL